jgi:putative ABC transport system permease protein
MNISQIILEALESINANKLRSSLTILGIIIGVAAVIAMLGVGQGAQETITGAISGVGSNLLFVFSGNMQDNVRNVQRLTTADAQALSDPIQAPSIQAVAPIVQDTLEITNAGETTRTTVYGVTPAYETVRNYTLLEGSFITNNQNLGVASVALIGPELATTLFNRQYGLIGETIRIGGQPFRIIGVLAPKGGSAFGSEDSIVLVPLATARARLIRRNMDRVDLIYVQARDTQGVEQASAEITQILRTRHRIIIGENDFTIFSQKDFVQVAGTITGVFTIFLGGVAGISLLVGGIGIMNIMLVSVTERTREIGLRKAVGARKRDILIQFLTESSLISLIGGLIGIALGYLISFVVGRIAAASGTPFTPVIRLDAILLATLFATAVGLFFGIYPASRAANLEPVEALRHD